MRAVLATAIVALAGSAAARPLTTVGDIADSLKAEGADISSGIGESSISGSGISGSGIGGSSVPSDPYSLGGSEDTDSILSSLGDDIDSGSRSGGINSGSGIGSSEINMDLDMLDEPSSLGRDLATPGISPSSSGIGSDGYGAEDFDLDSLDSSPLASSGRGISGGVGSDPMMPASDGFDDLSEEQLRQLVEYLTRMYEGLDAPEYNPSAGAGDTLANEGYGEDIYGEEDYNDDPFGIEGGQLTREEMLALKRGGSSGFPSSGQNDPYSLVQ